MLHHWLQTGLATTLLLSSINAQETPEVVFDCSVTPYACTNMCWGAYCSNYEVSLNFDAPSDATKTQRRKKAGCKPNPNRCNPPNNKNDPTNNSCDEYPFASTSNADDVQAVTRCIPAGDNNSQGGTLSSFYKNTLNGNAGDFIVGFGNPDDPNTQYCESGDQCINDGKQYLGTQLAPNGTQSKIKHKRNYYMLESGMPFLSTRELEEGTVVKKVIKRSNAEMTLMKRGGQDPYELVDDVVRARLE
ncbi:MAG: hypothetical protein ASARMPRED_000883 [Alectoria sarmentosa]|nr:MAG: hypothetical protein ASARMPRED_000883 [Alectoria sarmentosa]